MDIPPRQARAVRVEAAHGPLAALVASAPEGGERAGTVLLVPGYTGSKEDFAAILGPVAAAGFSAVALDLRGQYESPHAPDPASYDIPRLAEDVATVTAGLPGPVHLVGHSFGGLVARAAVLAHPGRWRSLVLMSSGPAAIPPPRADRIRQLQALGIDDLATLWGIIDALDREAGAVPPPALHDFHRTRWHRNDPVGLRRMGEALVAEPDRVDELAGAGLPTLVLFGTGDDAWPPALQEQMAGRLGAPVVRIQGAAHSPAAEAPEATADALVGWWASLG